MASSSNREKGILDHLDPQVDQGDFPKINCHNLFNTVCFHTRLDTVSVIIYRFSVI